jgi:cell division initiation protein
MELSPPEITQREFRRKLRGYDPEEVHTFLEQIAEEMTRLVQEATERTAQTQRLEAQVRILQERDDSVRNTLVSAQKMMDEIKANASREADMLLKETELKAEGLLEQAHRRLAQIQGEIAELIRQRDVFAAKLRGLLKTHLELLEFVPEFPGPRAEAPKAPSPAAPLKPGTPGVAPTR